MGQIKNIAKQLLYKLHENETVSSFKDLSNLLEFLENKTDPDQEEIVLVMSINETLEKLNSLENQLKNYVQSDKKQFGNKLDYLYKNTSFAVFE